MAHIVTTQGTTQQKFAAVDADSWAPVLWQVDVSPGANDLIIGEGPLDPATGEAVHIRYQDMGDGTWAEVVSVNGEGA